MLDLSFIRKNKELVKKNILRRGVDPKVADVDQLLELDEQKRKLLIETDALRSKKNDLAGQFVKADKALKENLKAEGEALKKQTQKNEEQLRKLEKEIFAILSWIPNILSEKIPDGEGENDNVETKVWDPDKGYMPEKSLGKGNNPKTRKFFTPLDFEGKDHLELGETLDLVDTLQAGKVSGSRFYYLKNEAVLFDLGLTALLTKELVKRGFSPLYPPLLVKERSLWGTSHFPEQKEQVYKIDAKEVEDQNQLYLVGSAEVPNFSYFMDKTIDAESLPAKVFAYTTCFRTEVGSWGKDVKGIKRVHQFNKLEMNVVCMPDDSEKIFNELLEINEWLLQALKQPYRVVQKCAKDAGYSATHNQYDVEIWSRAQNEFLEWGTDTNTTDYQARTLNIKYKTKDSKKGFAHTVNNTGLALPRNIIAWLENYQQKDGSVLIPEILRDFVCKDKIANPTK